MTQNPSCTGFSWILNSSFDPDLRTSSLKETTSGFWAAREQKWQSGLRKVKVGI